MTDRPIRTSVSLICSMTAGLLLGLGASLIGGEVQAQSPCPAGPGPGEVIMGETDGGGGMRVPLCAPNGAVGGGGGSGDYAGAAYSAQLAEAANGIREISEWANAEVARRGIDVSNVQMPEDQRLGRWLHPVNGQCAAAFVNGWGLVGVTGPMGDHPGVILTFWNGALPKPAQPRHVQIQMAQTDTPRQRVRAISFYDAGLQMGGLMVAVPSVDALLDNMPDVHNIKIWIGDEPAVNQDWQDGHAARDRLRACFRSARR